MKCGAWRAISSRAPPFDGLSSAASRAPCCARMRGSRQLRALGPELSACRAGNLGHEREKAREPLPCRKTIGLPSPSSGPLAPAGGNQPRPNRHVSIHAKPRLPQAIARAKFALATPSKERLRPVTGHPAFDACGEPEASCNEPASFTASPAPTLASWPQPRHRSTRRELPDEAPPKRNHS